MPNAVKANIIVTKTKETYEMVREDEAGYFAILIPEKEIPKYKIEIEDEEGKRAVFMTLMHFQNRFQSMKNSSFVPESVMKFITN